jgi:hypothetical protein
MLDELEAEAVILLEARAPSNEVTQTLRGLEGISEVAPEGQDDGWVSLEVQTRDNIDLREAVGSAVTGRGWPIRRLERKRRRLEDAYFDVLRAQDPLKHEPPASVPPSDAIQAPVSSA